MNDKNYDRADHRAGRSMTMTEKTEELIAEARRWANGHPNRRSGELMRDLADALEAANRERDAAEYRKAVQS